jgi:hypothetical protein
MIDLNNFKEELSLIKEENEILNLDLQKAIEIFEQEDLDSDYVKPMEVKTMYNTFKCFGDYSHVLMSGEDFEQFKKDMCNEFAQCLPDKFDEYVDVDKMLKDIDDGWSVVLYQVQDFIEQQGRNVFSIKKYEPTIYADDFMILEVK